MDERPRATSGTTVRHFQILAFLVLVPLTAPAVSVASAHTARHSGAIQFQPRSLDGRGNNVVHPTWGEAGTPYLRLAAPRYADGAGTQVAGPNPRYVSNRIFNDLGQNIFSERGVSQWAWTWGQFMDHTFGLAEDGDESTPIVTDQTDPLDAFRNDIGTIPFTRNAVAAGTGTSPARPRQQVNTVSSYIDGWSIYGGTASRLEWLREGPVDGDMSNNGAKLLEARGAYLPRASARGDAGAAPKMAAEGQLAGHPQDAAVSGDVRANENMALTAVHTLFVREHNRIVDSLPRGLTEQRKFQIARRVVGAEQQYITYRQFLPALGVKLPPYRGYRRNVNASIGNEFATVAYRAHSMIHGEFELTAGAARYTPARKAALEAMGVEVQPVAPSEPGAAPEVEFTVPLNVAFFNPDLVPDIGLGPILEGLGDESQYKNDEQIDNALRSVLFEFPGPDAPDPTACFSSPSAAGCFQGVVDLGALDVQRGRDHGMPTYNDMRRAYGLSPRASFTAITGEPTDRFPADPEIDASDPIDDPDILGFTKLFDSSGGPIAFGSEAAADGARRGVRRTTLAARLKAIYGSVDNVDAFVGMVSEAHVPGSEFGPLQLAMWKRQFEALRDGDRFFFARDRVLRKIRRRYGITYRHPLSELIALDAGVPRDDLPKNVFFAPADAAPVPQPQPPVAVTPRPRDPDRGRPHRHGQRQPRTT
jgi:hypothetical protein